MNFDKPQNFIETTNVEITDETTITYTPCYMQCGFMPPDYLRRTKPFCFIFVGRKFKI
jgi:hypothetical protein